MSSIFERAAASPPVSDVLQRAGMRAQRLGEMYEQLLERHVQQTRSLVNAVAETEAFDLYCKGDRNHWSSDTEAIYAQYVLTHVLEEEPTPEYHHRLDALRALRTALTMVDLQGLVFHPDQQPAWQELLKSQAVALVTWTDGAERTAFPHWSDSHVNLFYFERRWQELTGRVVCSQEQSPLERFLYAAREVLETLASAEREMYETLPAYRTSLFAASRLSLNDAWLSGCFQDIAFELHCLEPDLLELNDHAKEVTNQTVANALLPKRLQRTEATLHNLGVRVGTALTADVSVKPMVAARSAFLEWQSCEFALAQRPPGIEC